MKTPFQVMKERGAPDEVLVFLAALAVVVFLTPWLDISLGGVTLNTAIPWYVSLPAAAMFVLLLTPCIPAKTPPTPAEKELAHRFYWLREHLLVEKLTVECAHEACHALNGGVGAFRAAEEKYRDTHIEPIIRDVAVMTQWLEPATRLRRLHEKLPQGYRPNDMVDPNVAKELKEVAKTLPVSESGAG